MVSRTNNGNKRLGCFVLILALVMIIIGAVNFKNSWVFSIIFILIGLFFLLKGFVLFGEDKTKAEPLKEEELKKNKFSMEIPWSKYQRVFRSLYQAFETTYLLLNSSNTETVKSRLDFYQSLLPVMIDANEYNGFSKVVLAAKNKYESDYYDKPVTEEQMNIVMNPGKCYENWDVFYDTVLLECYKRYVQTQQEHIAALKTTRGKSNRRLLVIQSGNKLHEVFKTVEIKQNMKIYIDSLNADSMK